MGFASLNPSGGCFRAGATEVAPFLLCEDIMSDQPSRPSVSPLFAGLMCRCPQCGRGKLFRGFLGLPAHCDVCGLDYGFIDAGDGPALLVVFCLDFIVDFTALIVQATLQLP